MKKTMMMASALALLVAGCGEKAETVKAPTASEAMAFVEKAEAALNDASGIGAKAAWVQANFVTEDTTAIAAYFDQKSSVLSRDLAKESARFNDTDVDAETRRKLDLMRLGITIPTPASETSASELSALKASLDSTYASGTYCPEGKDECLNDRDIIRIMANSRDHDELLDAWQGWRTIAKPMKDDYARMVELANEGARDLGFADTGALWRSGYDMPADDFVAEADRLWDQVKPLYDELQCHVKTKVSNFYGSQNMPEDGTIPAHLLGNVWAQQWGEISDLVIEPSGEGSFDLEELLKANDYTPLKMVRVGEEFFTSMGLEPLDESFYERSLITKPRDRNVQCHASAWDMDYSDKRIKMCTEVTSSDFGTVHHELGHIFYYTHYKDQSILFQTGANDGFHEAIGDAVDLSLTPKYLTQIGLLDEEPDASQDINLLMNSALDKVAFLPFGLMVDKWRWGVFSGDIKPEGYNDAWWDLRRQYQGLSAPMERPADAFDPGAKYHIPGNTPYTRYFLAHILQFQFFKAACDTVGHEGPLHRCSFYGNEDVGESFKEMLTMGASKPWPDALESFTGTREMDGSAVLEYYAPLMTWLKEQNKDRECGW